MLAYFKKTFGMGWHPFYGLNQNLYAAPRPSHSRWENEAQPPKKIVLAR